MWWQVDVTGAVSVCADNTEAELLHTYSRVNPLDVLILCVRLAVLVAVTLTVPVVLFPVSTSFIHTCMWHEKGPKRWISVGWIVCTAVSAESYFKLIRLQSNVVWYADGCVLCVSRQIRRALTQLLFPGKPFHWLRHIIIAMCLLFAVNLLVIFVPNIRDIFGIIGGGLNW